MNAFLSRCRHARVHWLNSHSCHCLQCGKTGRWFETEGLVMWTRDQKKEDSATILPGSVPLPNSLDSAPALSGRAG